MSVSPELPLFLKLPELVKTALLSLPRTPAPLAVKLALLVIFEAPLVEMVSPFQVASPARLRLALLPRDFPLPAPIVAPEAVTLAFNVPPDQSSEPTVALPVPLTVPSERESLPLVVWLRSEEHTSELQSRENLVCRLLLEK